MIPWSRRQKATDLAGRALLFLSLLAGAANAAETPAAGRPEAVSPGELDRMVEMGTGCFTFSWSAVEGARGFELVAYGVDGTATGAEPPATPALRARVPATSAWTPSLDKCLAPGRYAWLVRSETAAGWSAWSEPRLFEVRAAAPPARPPVAREPGNTVSRPSLERLPPTSPGLRNAALESGLKSTPRGVRPLAGEAFAPLGCDRGRFSDVSPSNPYCAWIEQLARDEIAMPCESGPGLPERYCPDHPVTRGQIALLLERVMRGTDKWRPEQGDGTVANLPPALTDSHALFSPTHSDNVGQYTSITVGTDGLGLISYYDATYHLLKVAHCSNVNCSEATIPYLNFDTDSGQHSAIAIGADGFGLVSYYDNFSHDLAVLHCRNIVCSSVDVGYLDTAGDVGQYSSIAIGADGLGIISYYDNTFHALKAAHCANLACTSADAVNYLDYFADRGKYSSIAIGYDGLPLISYYIGESGVIKVAHCSFADCNGAQTTSLWIASGSQTALAIGADGLGLIAYQDGGTLKTTHCSNRFCNDIGAMTATPLDGGGVGEYVSITIGADGLGLISYYDATNQALKVAHCSNTACTAATLARIEGGGVGKYSSITIGADGLGLISFYDEAHGSIKVAHCANVPCAPYFRRR